MQHELKGSNTRYAHINGFTYCTYSETGDLIITCGFDGDFRTWQGIDDDDPSSKCLGEFIYCVVQYDNRLLACTDLNVVCAYTFPEIDRDGKVFRFTAPPTCVKVNKTLIAAGSEDTGIKVIPRNEDEQNEFELKGHEGPILYVDLSKNDLLATSSGDGTIKIWDLSEKKEIKTIDGFPKVTSFELANHFVTPSFDPQNGDHLAYCSGNEIIILDCKTWDVKMKLKHQQIKNDYSYCSYSFCGKYLAAGTINGEIILFDLIQKQPMSGNLTNHEIQDCITAIAWNPKTNGEFAFCDCAGHLGTITVQKNKEMNHNRRPNMILSEAVEIANDFDEDPYKYNGSDDDENGENCFSLEKLKNETLAGYNIENGDGSDGDDKSSVSGRQYTERCLVKSFIQQKPFQPGATSEEAEHRYLAWNNVGIVRSHRDDGDGSIDVEFHDVNLHHALHISNYLNHTMASLSSTVIALSSYNSSKLVCITLGASGSREWSIELPDCEDIIAIVATTKMVAVATDNRYVRIFSVMGTQREVLSIPGPVVAMCGHDDKLMVTYHSAPASDDQHISAMLLHTFGLTLRCRDVRIPITPGKKITWIGYSDKGSPVCYDTMGLLKMYSMKTNCWYPICDTMKHAVSVSNNFYIVDVLESSQVVQAILCRGCSYPVTSPRPIVTELPMQLPLCEIESDKSMLEDSLVRWSNFSVDDSERMIKETVIKLFALACRTEMEARAKELIEMIASPHLLSLAVKYASKLGRIHLADKLSELLPQLEKQEREREKQMKEADTEVINLIQNSSLGENLLLLQKNKLTTPSTPVQTIAPKPMVLSSGKRNPFKKTSTASATPLNKSNSLKHLTEKIIGAESTQVESEQQTEEEQVSSTVPNTFEPKFKQNKNEDTPTRENFVGWFMKNKDQFKENHPEVNDLELAKIALTEYRHKSNEDKESDSSSGKRKLDESSDENQSGISKLARFGFKK